MTDEGLRLGDRGPTRREVLRAAAVGGAALGAGGLAACGDSGNSGNSTAATSSPEAVKLRSGGDLRVGLAGGGPADTVDAHVGFSAPDEVRRLSLYEPLGRRSADFKTLELLVAESFEPEQDRADAWVVRVREGLEFHDGKPVTADDVIFSIKRILDPKDPKSGAALLGSIDVPRLKKLDARTLRIPLKFPNSGFPYDLSSELNGIVPVGYDPRKPVGSGPFVLKSFEPGRETVLTKFPNYWRTGRPYVDSLTVIGFADHAARVNALLGGQVHAIGDVPSAQVAQLEGDSRFKVQISETGSFEPFTMRVDQAPFDDVRVRQAMRLIVDRKQLIEQVYDGRAQLGNDLYAIYDPAYDSSLPQREQDLEQAKSLLKAAGKEGLRVQLVTAPLGSGLERAAEVFVQQATGAGVKVELRKVDPTTFFGPNYLKWTFSQDFWLTDGYLQQAAGSTMPDSPANETHWDDPEYLKLIAQARAEIDEAKRNEILHAAQKIEYERGGYIIPAFVDNVDAYSAEVGGYKPSKRYALNDFRLYDVGFVA